MIGFAFYSDAQSIEIIPLYRCFDLLYPEMTDATEECKTIIDIVESAWLNGVPEGTSEECKLIEIFHSALPKPCLAMVRFW